MTAIATAVRAPLTANRRYAAAMSFGVLGLIDLLVLGLLAHPGDAAFTLSQGGSGIQIPVIRVPAAPVCFALGAVCIGMGVLRATTELSLRNKRLTVAAVLLCFVVSLLCWADAGSR